MWLAPTTTVTSLLLRRFNGSKSCRAALLLLIHQTSFFTTTTTTTFNSSSSSSSSKFGGGGSFILHDQQQANNLHTTTTTTFNSSSKFGGAGTFILHDQQQAANNLHTTTSSPSSSSSSSSSKFGDTTFILQTYEPSVDSHGGKIDDIKMFMLSSGSGDDGTTGEEEDKDDDDDQKKKKTVLFKLSEDLGFSAIHKDFQLQDSIRMVGSHNGIICLHDPMLHFPQLLRDVYLWNPATRHFRILPLSIHIPEQMAFMAFRDFVGFGFDVDTQDYKVLRICPLSPYSDKAGGCKCRVQVYSLSSDSWRVLDGIDSLPLSPEQVPFRNGGQGTYLNGSCFFLGTKPIKKSNGILDLMVLSFDFNKEIFTIIRELPECYTRKLVLSGLDVEDLDIRDLVIMDLDIRDLSYLVVHNNTKPDVFITPRIDFAGGYVFTTDKIDLYSKGGGGYWQYSMWVINEQDSSSRVVEYEKKPWAKLREFRIKTKSRHLYSKPRCVSNDGELVLISTSTDTGRNKLMLFNLVTKKVIQDFTIGDRDCRAVYVYKESQVSIMGAGNAHFRWQLPTPGTTYKLNLDAHYTGDYSDFGIGLCLTSDTGGCIGVRSLKRHVGDAVHGEAQAMFEAIKWAKELQLSPIIVESDSKNMVSFFMEDDDNNLLTYWSSEHAHSVLKEAKLILKSSENSISFQYCSRSCNYVADIAAKLGRDETTWYCKDWKADSPGEVVMSLSKDLGLETEVDYLGGSSQHLEPPTNS